MDKLRPSADQPEGNSIENDCMMTKNTFNVIHVHLTNWRHLASKFKKSSELEYCGHVNVSLHLQLGTQGRKFIQ